MITRGSARRVEDIAGRSRAAWAGQPAIHVGTTGGGVKLPDELDALPMTEVPSNRRKVPRGGRCPIAREASRHHSDDRYRPERAEASYWLLTVATATRFAFEAARAWVAAPWLGWVVVIGGLGQAVGLVLYFWTLWPRIRAVGSHLREARGERF